MDVEKIGRIPNGGGWRALGRAEGHRERKVKIGDDYVHSLVDDHSRLAYSETPSDEKARLRGVSDRAVVFLAAHGITRIERVMTDRGAAKGIQVQPLALRIFSGSGLGDPESRCAMADWLRGVRR